MRFDLGESKYNQGWHKQFAFVPTEMSDEKTVVWLEFFETRWGRKYATGANSNWLRRPVGSKQEYPVSVSKRDKSPFRATEGCISTP